MISESEANGLFFQHARCTLIAKFDPAKRCKYMIALLFGEWINSYWVQATITMPKDVRTLLEEKLYIGNEATTSEWKHGVYCVWLFVVISLIWWRILKETSFHNKLQGAINYKVKTTPHLSTRVVQQNRIRRGFHKELRRPYQQMRWTRGFGTQERGLARRPLPTSKRISRHLADPSSPQALLARFETTPAAITIKSTLIRCMHR